MKIYDRKNKILIEEKTPISMKFLYNTFIGRFFLKIISFPLFSKLAFYFFDSHLSCLFINKFVNKYKIDLNLFSPEKFKSFNDFFKRSYKKLNLKNKDKKDLISICDSKLSYYEINENLILQIKNSNYSITDLIQDSKLSEEYSNGTCLIFRLTPEDYHRYIFFDSGRIDLNKKIKGKLHSVKPIAQYKYPVFTQNCREISILDTDNFGKVIQIEIGALLIGKIKNSFKVNSSFNRYDEKGYFEYGGSTICLLFKKNVIEIDEDIKSNSRNNTETKVKIGEKIGKAV